MVIKDKIFDHKIGLYHISKAQELSSEEVKVDTQTEEQDRVTPGWFSYQGAAVYTGLSETSLWRLVRSGSLRPARLGRTVRFSREELDMLLESRRDEK